MARRLNIAPTKSNHLRLNRQLEFAKDGFDLLEQKRQILVYELMSRLGQAQEIERRVTQALNEAFGTLREATLDIGSAALEDAALAVKLSHSVAIEEHAVIGIRLPRVILRSAPASRQFGLGGTSASADAAMYSFVALVALIGQLAELESAVLRLARELRKTQRRCNALSRVFIPEYESTIDFIEASLEEREREFFVNLRMIKQRLEGERELADVN